MNPTIYESDNRELQFNWYDSNSSSGFTNRLNRSESRCYDTLTSYGRSVIRSRYISHVSSFVYEPFHEHSCADKFARQRFRARILGPGVGVKEEYSANRSLWKLLHARVLVSLYWDSGREFLHLKEREYRRRVASKIIRLFSHAASAQLSANFFLLQPVSGERYSNFHGTPKNIDENRVRWTSEEIFNF